MPPFSARFLPDLQYYFSKFCGNNMLDKNVAYTPGNIYPEHMNLNKSFLRILFEETWEYGLDYTIGYKFTPMPSWPASFLDRLSIYQNSQLYCPEAITYRNPFYSELPEIGDSTSTDTTNFNSIDTYLYVSTTGEFYPTNTASIMTIIQEEENELGINLFNLTHCDIVAIDSLAHYRAGQTINVFIHENIEPPRLLETPGGFLLSLNLNLVTPLTRLIAIFLYTIINNDHQYYNVNEPIGKSPVDCLFEVYIVNKIFKFITNSGPDYVE